METHRIRERCSHIVSIVLTLFLVTGLFGSDVFAATRYSLPKQPSTTVAAPPVILQAGTAGTSTIYTNYTSAKVSVVAPLPNYDFVDNNTSNVDSSGDKGTHSNFTAQQYGPDLISDTLSEQNSDSHSLDATGGYMIVGAGTPNWGSVTGTISFWIEWDAVANRPWGQHENMETRFSGSNLWLDWGASNSLTSGTSFIASEWYFIAIAWNENTDKLYLYVGDENNPPTQDASNNIWTSAVSTVGVTQNNFMASKGGVNPTDGRGNDLRYWNTDRTLAQIQGDYKNELTGSETNLRSYFKLNNNFDDIGPNNNDGSGSGSYSFSSNVPIKQYELDLEVQWTSADYSETNEYLCLYAMAIGSESVRVDAWTGSSWTTVISALQANQWNNVSVGSYLTSSTFTIRFKGTNESGDATQDSWNIDVTLLEVWPINIQDFVDNNTSDVDNSSDKGTHGNFSAQQYGPDSINDVLTESGVTVITITASWGADVSSGGTKYPNDGSDYLGNSSTSYRVANKFPLTNLPSGASVTKVEVIFAVSLAGGADHLTDIHPYNGSGQANPETDSGSSMYTRSAAGTAYVNDNTGCRTTGVKTFDLGSQACTDVMNAKTAVDRFSLGWHEEGDNSAHAELAEYTDATNPPKLRITYVENCKLDLEVQWTNVDWTQTYEELCIYGGAMGGENIMVDVWNGSGWINLFADLNSGWNNVSVSSYLTSSTFTIRFKGGNETGDTTQDSWNIDATLLHVWTETTYDHVLKVVNQGSNAWNVSLKVYSSSNIARVSSTTISFHDGTSSDQIIVSNGVITQSQGALYNLAGSATIYISMNSVLASATGTSYLYVYLKILVPSTTTYSLYVITFEIT